MFCERRSSYNTLNLDEMRISIATSRRIYKLLVVSAVTCFLLLLLKNKDETKFKNNKWTDENFPVERLSDSKVESIIKEYSFSMKPHQTVAEKDIFNYLVPYDSSNVANPKCSSNIMGGDASAPYHRTKNLDWPKFSNLLANLSGVSAGGEWQPDHCVSQFWVAIMIPVQNRESNLRDVLLNLHPFLQRQQIKYKIFAIELDSSTTWNRGTAFNAGFIEIMKEKPFPCIILHDVDMLPKHRNHIYACTTGPRFMYVSRSPPYVEADFAFFGGVTAILSDHYKLINGFSNKFFLWGAEDVDLYNRMVRFNLPIMRFEPKISSFHHLSHIETKRGDKKKRDRLFVESLLRPVEGLNTTKFKLIKKEIEPLCTRIIISF